MTATVTVKHGNKPVYIYMAELDENQNGDFKLASTLEEGEQTFYVHKALDILVTENELEE